MEDKLKDLQQKLRVQKAEMRRLEQEIQKEQSLAWDEARRQGFERIREKHGTTIDEINVKIQVAIFALKEANALAKKAGIPSLTGYSSCEDTNFDEADLILIGECLDLRLLTEELYKAGVENITW